MKTTLATLLLLSCLAPAASARQAGAPPNASNTNTNAPMTIEVKPGETAKIVVGRQDERGGLSRLAEGAESLGKVLSPLLILLALLTFWRESRKNREERRESRQQREEELRWRKAQLAKELLDKLHSDTHALDAMLMLDWDGRKFSIKAGGNQQKEETVTIGRSEMWAALRVTELGFDKKEEFIRDCFDAFFGRMQAIVHYISIDLIDPKDVQYPFSYYVSKLDENPFMVGNFIGQYHPRVAEFIECIKDAGRCPRPAPPKAEKRKKGAAKAKAEPEASAEAGPPLPDSADYLFDCPPAEGRFVVRLEKRELIKAAREILSGERGGRLRGDVVDGATEYNGRWPFHVRPDSVEFIDSSTDFSRAVSERAEADAAEGGAPRAGEPRLLAELPVSRLDGGQARQDAVRRGVARALRALALTAKAGAEVRDARVREETEGAGSQG